MRSCWLLRAARAAGSHTCRMSMGRMVTPKVTKRVHAAGLRPARDARADSGLPLAAMMARPHPDRRAPCRRHRSSLDAGAGDADCGTNGSKLSRDCHCAPGADAQRRAASRLACTRPLPRGQPRAPGRRRQAKARVVFMGDSITDAWQQPRFGGSSRASLMSTAASAARRRRRC